MIYNSNFINSKNEIFSILDKNIVGKFKYDFESVNLILKIYSRS